MQEKRLLVMTVGRQFPCSGCKESISTSTNRLARGVRRLAASEGSWRAGSCRGLQVVRSTCSCVPCRPECIEQGVDPHGEGCGDLLSDNYLGAVAPLSV